MKKLSRLVATFVLLASFSAPLLVSAVTCTGPFHPDTSNTICIANSSTVGGGVDSTYLDFYKNLIQGTINNYLVPILFAIAFIFFLFGVYKYFILGAADEKSRTDGKQFVLWGIIGFVIISSVWGLVNLVKDTIIPSAADSSTHPDYPKL